MRLPLYIKLMASYLIVFGLVFVPTFFFLRTGLRDEVRKAMRAGLEGDVTAVARQLAAYDDRSLPTAAEALARQLSQRLTLIDLTGRVLADSVAPGRASTLENHFDRPEVAQALLSGVGYGSRVSATTGKSLLYVARRFPDAAPHRAIVRLAIPTGDADQAGQNLSSHLNTSGAIALSAAVLLSLLAAMVVSRPLRRIAAGARAIANGDFGFAVDVHTGDELGEVAQALGELAQKLRGRLIEAGADRMTLRALMDEVPVGIVLFDGAGHASVVNGRARALCGLPPARELEVASRLLQLPEQVPVAKRVLETTASEEVPLIWVTAGDGGRAPQRLVARWVAVAGPGGERLPAVILRDAADPNDAAASLHALMGVWARRLHETLSGFESAPQAAAAAANVVAVADEMERLAPHKPIDPAELRVVPVGELVSRALSRARGGAAIRGLELVEQVSMPETLVVESGGRCERAVAWLVIDAVRRAEAGERILLRDEVHADRVRVWIRLAVPAWDVGGMAALLTPLGGDAGIETDRDLTEAWVVLPRG